MRGVPKGYREVYGYHGRWDERKVGPRKWNFAFTATKRRDIRGRGGPQPGSHYRWKIDAVQDAWKTRRGEYQTFMTGTKRLVKARVR
jgi:hypothetical protein